ncbi:biotin/lipoyl-binding protein [Bradyrhizobium sp.]|uniref:biotin/lipoyl-binding protein n=1 Tax=Bradyrhizobium sp. TaxID=376 RepID=UPI003C28398E
MRRARRAAIVAIPLVLVAGVLVYSERRSGSPVSIVGVVRATEVRVEPEVDGQLASIAVEKGAHVHAGDVLARLSAVELTAQADQARPHDPCRIKLSSSSRKLT